MPVAKITFITGIEADAGKGVADSLDPGITRTISGTFLGTLAPDEALQISVNGGTTWIDANTTAGTWTVNGIVLESGRGSLLARTIDSQGHSLDVISPATLLDVAAISPAGGTASTGSSTNWQQQLFIDLQDPEGNETRNATASSAAAHGVLAEETSFSDRLGESQPGHDTSNTAELGVAELAAAKTQPSSELLFIDGGISGYEQLIAGARSGVQVIVLDATRNGFEQITAALAGREDIATIHLVTHGDAGRVALGNSVMSVQSLDEHAAEVSAWSASLSPGADFLIYGCDVGQGIQGETLLNKLSALTGADPAASSNLTGSGPLGGDWKLEVSHGTITSQAFAQTEALAGFNAVLGKPVIDLNGPTVLVVQDDFSDASPVPPDNSRYSHGTSNLTRTWTSGWVEFDASSTRSYNPPGSTNSDNSPIGGNVINPSVKNNTTLSGTGNTAVGTGQEMVFISHINQPKDYLERPINLKAYTSAILSFDYRTASVTGTDTIEVDASLNGGANYTALGTLAAAGTNTSASFDISSFISDATTIRFAIKSGFNTSTDPLPKFYFDNVKITADGNNFVTDFSEDPLTPPQVKILSTEAGNLPVITDPDAGQLLKNATVTLNNKQTGDVLDVGTLPSGFTPATVFGNNGVTDTITVTLTSATGDTAANFLSALNAITFSNPLHVPNITLRNISVTVTDAANETSLPSTTFVRVLSFDDPVMAPTDNNVPVSALGTTTGILFDGTTLETQRTSSGTLDYDLDTVALSTALLPQPGLNQLHGVATVNANGTYTYTPNANQAGQTDSFTYTLTSKAQVVGTNYQYWDMTNNASDAIWLDNTSPNHLIRDFFPATAPYKTGFITGYDVDAVALDTVGGSKTANTSLDNFLVRFTNTLTIRTAGSYIFTTGSDDGSRVAIDTDGNGTFSTIAVDNDGVQAYFEFSGAAVTLAAGTYTIRADFYERGGQEDLRFWYQGPDTGGLRTDIADVGTVLRDTSTTGTVNVAIADSGPRLALGGNEYALDNFGAVDLSGNPIYTNNVGFFSFASGWTETDDGSASTGEIKISSEQLQVQDTSNTGQTTSISRSVDLLNLSGIAPQRVGYQLSFDYGASAATDGALVQISRDGGASWTTLDTIISSGGATSVTHKTYDISNFASSNTKVQFVSTASTGIPAINFDNVKFDASVVNNAIAYQEGDPGPGTAIGSIGTAVGDPSGSSIARATVSIANAQSGDMLTYDNIFPWIIPTFSGGTLTLVGMDTTAQYATALQHVFFSSTSENPTQVASSRTINVSVTDTGNYVSNTAVATVTVTGVNDAPLGVDASVGTPFNTPYILRTADFAFTDVENNALLGVKFTTVPSSIGTLQLNTGGLGTWNTIAANATITAADISAGRVRLLPNTGDSGDATFTFQVQDNGGTSPGVDTDPVANNFTIRVLSGVNTPPNLAGAGILTLTSSPEDSTAPTAKTITQILSDSGGTTFSDPDSGAAMTGLAIIGNTANAGTQGTWQYSTDGTIWTNVGTVGNTAVTALAVSAATQMRFLSVANYNGTPPALSVRVLDDTYIGSFSTNVVPTYLGTTAFASTAISNTGTLYSLGTSVTPVNDAPVLIAAVPTLNSITSAQSGNAGQLVSTFLLLDSVGTTTSTTQTVTRDVADGSAVNGIAIFGTGGSAGTWQYNTGSGWLDVGSVSTEAALLLRSTDSIRFNPDGTGAGSGALTYKAWDQTAGSVGTKVDATVAGGTSAFSNSVDSAFITVTSATTLPRLSVVGSAPTFTEAGSAAAIDASIVVTPDSGPNNITGATITISNFVTGDTLAAPSLPGGISILSNVSGVLTLTGATTAANYQTALRAVTYSNALDAPNTAPRTITFQVTDATGGSNVLSASVNVAPTNDAPVLAGAATAPVYAKNQAAILIDPTITVSDADNPANFNTGFLQVTVATPISGEDKLSVLTTGVGPTQITVAVNGTDVTYGGVIIGTIDAALDGDDGNLKIALNLDSTPAAVQALAQSIGYQDLLSTPTGPALVARAVTFTLNDGSNVGGPAALTGTKGSDTIKVSNIDPPVISTVTDNVGTITGNVSSGGQTDDTVLVLTGTNLNGATVNIYNGATLLGAATVTGTSWTFTTGTLGNATTYNFNATQTKLGDTSGPTAIYPVTVDTVAPTVTVTDNVTGTAITTTGTVAYTYTFNEPVVGLTSGDFTVTNGTVSSVTGSGTTWTVNVTPTNGVASGNITMQLNASAVTDIAGNPNAINTNSAQAIDTLAPTGTPTIVNINDNVGPITGNVINAGSTNDTVLQFNLATASANATVNLYDNGTLIVAGRVANGSGALANFNTTALTNGFHSFTLREVDTAGNLGPASAARTLTVDTVAPTVTVTDNVPGIANTTTGTVVYTYLFSEPVTGLTSADFSVNNGTVGTVSGSGTTWTVNVTPATNIGSANITLTLASGAVTDAAGNQNPVDTNSAQAIDTRAPTGTPAITSFTDDIGSITGTNAFPFAGTTDDTLPLFTGTASNNALVNIYDGVTLLGQVTASGAGAWTFTHTTPLSSGAHSFTAKEADVAGNEGTASTARTLTVDTLGPTVAVADNLSGTANIANVSTANGGGNTVVAYTYTFNENVTGLTAGDFTVTNGTISSVVGTGPTNIWTVNVFAAPNVASGNIELQLAAGAVTDAAGNVNGQNTNFAQVIDTLAPTVTVTDNVPGTANSATGTVAYTYTFSEPVTGLASGDFTVTNGTVSGVSGSGTSWTVNVTPTNSVGSGNITVQLNANAVTDAAGNPNALNSNSTQAIDTLAPTGTPTITSFTDDFGSTTGTNAFPFAGTTDDTLPLFTGTASNNALVNVYDGVTLLGQTTANGSGAWTFTPSSPLSNGAHSFTAKEADSVGNTGAASSPARSLTIDPPPTLTVTDNVGGTANILTGTVAYTYTFSESVSGLTAGDFTMTNGTISSVSGSGTTWTVNVTPASNVASGNIQLVLAAGAVTDSGSNPNAADTNNAQAIDTFAPTVTVTDNVAGTVNRATGTVAYTYTFNESVTGLASDDFNVTNGTVSSVTGSGTAWTVNVTPTLGVASGNITMQLNAGAVFDAANNPNAININATQAIDTVAPAITPVITTVTEGTSTQTAVSNGGSTFDTQPTLNGTAEASSTVTVYSGTTVIGTTTSDSGGNWTLTPSSPLRDALNRFSATSADAAGNSSPTSGTWDLTVHLGLAGGTNLSTNGLRIPGEFVGDQSGFAMRGAGDINGDGFDDLIIGAPYNDANGTSSGRNYVVFGQAAPFNLVLPLNTINGNNGFRISGLAAGDASGWAVSDAGDVNGDGFADVVIGAIYADANGPTAGTAHGAAYVVFGKSSFPLDGSSNFNLATLDGANGFKISGAAAFDLAGITVNAAGDINGDGFGDVIVGAPYANPEAGAYSGAGYVVFGKGVDSFGVSLFTGSINLSTLTASDGFRVKGLAANDTTGMRMDGLGDINGDGYGDLIIAANRADIGGKTDSGAAYVVFGGSSNFGADLDLATLNVSSGFPKGFRIVGASAGDQLGWGIGNAGDVNGDGLADIIVSTDHAGASAGAAYVIFGKADFSGLLTSNSIDLSNTTTLLNGTNGFRISGGAAGDRAGFSVSTAGDFNGDGYGDLIVGAPGAVDGSLIPGQSYVVFGKSSFTSTSNLNLGTLGGSDGFKISGIANLDDSGYQVSTVGDINGDGFDDIAVSSSKGTPGESTGSGINGGETYVIFGGTLLIAGQTQIGTTGDDPIPGTSAAETLVGGQGNDTIEGNGGNDAMSGGSGNDTLHLGVANQSAIPFIKIDGGNGFDTLMLDGSGVSLNLSALGDKIQGIERIDLTGSGNNSVTLNLRDVLNISDTSNRLMIRGDAGDSVTSQNQNWALSSSGQVTDHGVVYDSYTPLGVAYSKGIPNLLVEHTVNIIV